MLGRGIFLDRLRKRMKKPGARGTESHANNIDIHFLAISSHIFS
jgi:hypothetical protein